MPDNKQRTLKTLKRALVRMAGAVLNVSDADGRAEKVADSHVLGPFDESSDASLFGGFGITCSFVEQSPCDEE